MTDDVESSPDLQTNDNCGDAGEQPGDDEDTWAGVCVAARRRLHRQRHDSNSKIQRDGKEGKFQTGGRMTA